MKSLWMTVILSAVMSQCDGQEDESLKKFEYEVESPQLSLNSEVRLSKHAKEVEALTLIYTQGRKVFQVRSNRPYEYRELRRFDQRVTGLAKDGSYIFVSTRNGGIWRAKVTDSKVDPNSWEGIVNLASRSGNVVGRIGNLVPNITCLSAAKRQLYVGLKTGQILRCSGMIRYTCAYFADFSPSSIKAIDYDPVDDWIYASAGGLLYKCPANVNEPCTGFTINKEVRYVTALKSGFDSLWMGTKRGEFNWPGETWLYKRRTRLDLVEGNSPAFYEEFFGDPLIDNDVEISSIDTAGPYVYLAVADGEDIWRCEPKRNVSLACNKTILNLPEMKYFVIV